MALSLSLSSGHDGRSKPPGHWPTRMCVMRAEGSEERTLSLSLSLSLFLSPRLGTEVAPCLSLSLSLFFFFPRAWRPGYAPQAYWPPICYGACGGGERFRICVEVFLSVSLSPGKPRCPRDRCRGQSGSASSTRPLIEGRQVQHNRRKTWQ